MKTELLFTLLISCAAHAVEPGRGVNTATLKATERCVEGETQFIPHQVGSFMSDYSPFLGPAHSLLSGENNFSGGSLKRENDGSLENQFVKLSQKTNNVVYSRVYMPASLKFGNEKLIGSSLTPKAQKLGSDEAAFRSACGDKFVSETVVGAELWLSLRVEIPNASASERSAQCMEAWQWEVGDNWMALTKLSSRSKVPGVYEACKDASVNLMLLQRGGGNLYLPDVGRTWTVTLGATTLSTYVCMREGCAVLARKLAEYLAGPNGFFRSVNPNAAPDSTAGPARLDHFLSSY